MEEPLVHFSFSCVALPWWLIRNIIEDISSVTMTCLYCLNVLHTTFCDDELDSRGCKVGKTVQV